MKTICRILNLSNSEPTTEKVRSEQHQADQRQAEQHGVGDNQPAENKPPQCAAVYAAVAPRPCSYRHGAQSRVVGLTSRSCPCPTFRMFQEEPTMLHRLARRGVMTFDFCEFLSVCESDLKATGVTAKDVASVTQRLFLFASGGLPIGNSAPQRKVSLCIPTATIICRRFGNQIRNSFEQLSNGLFIERLEAAIAALKAWGESECDQATTTMENQGQRGQRPFQKTSAPTIIRQSQSLLLTLTDTADDFVALTGLEQPELEHPRFDRTRTFQCPSCQSDWWNRQRSRRLNAEELRDLGRLAALACPC